MGLCKEDVNLSHRWKLRAIRPDDHGGKLTNEYSFPAEMVMPPGGCTIVYWDSNLAQGPRHAPFHLSSDAQFLMFTGQTANRSRTLIEWVRSPASIADEFNICFVSGLAWLIQVP